MYQNLINHLTKYLYCPDDIQEFSEFFQYKQIKKKEFLLREGEICKFEAFVTKGLFRTYYIDINGDEHILNFAIEDWWLTDFESFIHQTPSSLYIEALEESEILFISKEDKEHCFRAIPSTERLFRIMTINTHIALQRRMINNLSKTADQRYLDFITQYPILAQKLPNIQIAKYLGVSHEFISKIRKKVLLKN